MNTFKKTIPLFLFSTAIATFGCSKEEAKTNSKTVQPSQNHKSETKHLPQKKSKEESVNVKSANVNVDTSFASAMMKSYEICRFLLASDKSDLSDCSQGIIESVKTAHKDAPESTHEHVTAMGAAAEALRKISADDIEAVRLGFGELSKATVAMLTAAPLTAKNYHIFECPMAKGYKRWVQPEEKLMNPYMGTKMSSCGTEVHE